MSDPYYDGVTTPDPERERLFQSVFRPSPLEVVAEAVSAATGICRNIYVERRGDHYRWSLTTTGGPYPMLRMTAQFLKMDYCSLGGVGSRVVADGDCAQIVDDEHTEPDALSVLSFDEPTTADAVRERIEGAL
jgi:hypothetical protein